jgi:signal transduction histidine kinase
MTREKGAEPSSDALSYASGAVARLLRWLGLLVLMAVCVRTFVYVRMGTSNDLLMMSMAWSLAVCIGGLWWRFRRGADALTIGRSLVFSMFVFAMVGLFLAPLRLGPYVASFMFILVLILLSLCVAVFEKPECLAKWGVMFVLGYMSWSVVRWFYLQNVAPLSYWGPLTVAPSVLLVLIIFLLREVVKRYVFLLGEGEQARAALGLSLEEAKQARDEAISANQSKSAFLANMSHELRTPLNAIMGYAELLREEAEDAGHTQYTSDAGKVREAGQHLLSLIDELLDLSRLEAEQLKLVLHWLSMADELAQIENLMGPLVSRQGNVFRLEVEPEVLAREWQIDPLRVRQCMLNLLGNAAKFTTNGEIRLEVGMGRDEASGDECLEFAVRDTGIGMTEEQCHRIFEPFWQVDPSSTRRVGGVGLGLSLTMRLWGLMGGTLRVESQVGEGTCFRLSLPVPSRVA